jgi:hypothetical protein
VPGGIRTPNLLIRSQKLYPVELQAQMMEVKGERGEKKQDRTPKPLTNYLSLLTHLKPGGRRDSNPQQPEPQSGALPLSYGHHR